VKFVFEGDMSGITNSLDFTVNLVQGAGGILWDLVSGVGSAIETAGNLLGFAQGGTVPGTIGTPTIAVVHGGETIIPAGGSGTGNTYYLQFYGLTNEELPGKVKEVLRDLGADYHL